MGPHDPSPKQIDIAIVPEPHDCMLIGVKLARLPLASDQGRTKFRSLPPDGQAAGTGVSSPATHASTEAHMLRILFALFAGLLAVSARAEPLIEYLKPQGLLNVPSFSQVTTARGGKLVFVSGQVAWDEKGKPLFPGDLEAQTRKTYDNLKLALAAAGASFEDVVKFTVYVKDLDTEKWKLISKVRSGYLSKERPPASTMIGVTSLVYDELLIEIEAYAVVKE